VVKWHLDTHGKNYITTEYVEKLDETITHGIPIDLRTREEKILIANWKEKYVKKEEHDEDDRWHGSVH
jgi:3'-phosphoadenosine 5'-phosphosulfate sulfotransferase (PAPS reductase)/FAD synthetase